MFTVRLTTSSSVMFGILMQTRSSPPPPLPVWPFPFRLTLHPLFSLCVRPLVLRGGISVHYWWLGSLVFAPSFRSGPPRLKRGVRGGLASSLVSLRWPSRMRAARVLTWDVLYLDRSDDRTHWAGVGCHGGRCGSQRYRREERAVKPV